MKYIGKVIDTTTRKNRAETRISIEGLAKPQQIAVIWSISRSPDALVELTPGTRVIFAAREETLTQRTHVDDTTGAIGLILVAMGKFYDIIADTRPAEDIYDTIEEHDLLFEGTVADKQSTADGRSITIVMDRHGQVQPLETRWPGHLIELFDHLRVGDEVTVTAPERSLTWRVSVEKAGRRAIVPAVTASGIRIYLDEVGRGKPGKALKEMLPRHPR